MNSTELSPKLMSEASSARSRRTRRQKENSDSTALGFDIFSLLTYISAVAGAGLGRDALLENTLRQDNQLVVYFQRVFVLAKSMGVEYYRAFALVGRQAKAARVRSLLLRLAGAVASGEGVKETIDEELEVEKEQFSSQYERSVESLRKWTDAYVAVLVSVTLVMVIVMISSIISDVANNVMVMVGLTVVAITGLFAYVIYRTAPVEVKTYSVGWGPSDRRKAFFLLSVGGLLGVLAALVVWKQVGLGPAVFAFGIFLLPAGLYSLRDDNLVDRIDRDLPNFVRVLGVSVTTLQTTIPAVMAKMDPRYTGSLEPYVNRLSTRLSYHLNPKYCWERFIAETGSEMVRRVMRPFVDAVHYGARGSAAGAICSQFALKISLLRARRALVASSFTQLMIPMHVVVTALLVFIFQILVVFNTGLSEAVGNFNNNSQDQMQMPTLSSVEGLPIDPGTLPFFQTQDLGFIYTVTIGVILLITAINTFVPHFAAGGHILKCSFFGSLMVMISGLSLTFIPPVVTKLFAM